MVVKGTFIESEDPSTGEVVEVIGTVAKILVKGKRMRDIDILETIITIVPSVINFFSHENIMRRKRNRLERRRLRRKLRRERREARRERREARRLKRLSKDNDKE